MYCNKPFVVHVLDVQASLSCFTSQSPMESSGSTEPWGISLVCFTSKFSTEGSFLTVGIVPNSIDTLQGTLPRVHVATPLMDFPATGTYRNYGLSRIYRWILCEKTVWQAEPVFFNEGWPLEEGTDLICFVWTLKNVAWKDLYLKLKKLCNVNLPPVSPKAQGSLWQLKSKRICTSGMTIGWLRLVIQIRQEKQLDWCFLGFLLELLMA